MRAPPLALGTGQQPGVERRIGRPLFGLVDLPPNRAVDTGDLAALIEARQPSEKGRLIEVRHALDAQRLQ